MKDNNTQESAQQQLSFAAIDIKVEQLVVAPTESRTGAGSWVRWGDGNQYPHFIGRMAKECNTLRACILGLADYVCGDDIVSTVPGAADIIRATAISAGTFGGWAWHVVRAKDGTLIPVEVLRVPFLRTDEDCQQFWYDEKWHKGSYGKHTVYGKWINQPGQQEGIVWVKLWGDDAYPEPCWSAAVKSALTEIGTDDYHLGNIERGFMASYILNINNGIVPTDDEKKAIEREIARKLFGAHNAGRVMLSFNRNKDFMTTTQKLDSADFSDKYMQLDKHSARQIFTAFRANPNLFGVATESNGFNSEEYEQAFKLFNRTMVLPIQRRIIDVWEKLYGPGTLTIKPFTLEGTTSANIVD